MGWDDKVNSVISKHSQELKTAAENQKIFRPSKIQYFKHCISHLYTSSARCKPKLYILEIRVFRSASK